jgi:phosphoglycerate dehydrogenase-like enzyme
VSVSVWVRDHPQLALIGELPQEVELHTIPHDGPLPPGLEDAEFVVPPVRARALLEKLAQMPRLAVVQSASAGTDWLEPWVPEGVTLCNARGTRDTAVAEWALAVILAMEKRLGDFAQAQAEHAWRTQMLDELADKRVLIVGYGSIGSRLADMLRPLQFDVRAVASKARDGVHGVQELAELLPAADIVVVLVPLTPETRGLFDDRMLSLMRTGSLLVNAARGPVVDTAALLERLNTGRLRAALDVTDPEPLPPDHPLWDAPGTLITPHLAGDSPQAEERAYGLIGDQIRRYVNQEELLNVVKR